MLHEQQQELAQSFVRGVLREQPCGGRAKFVDLLAVHLGDERFACSEVAVEGADRHPGPAGDLLHVGVGVAGEERLPGRCQKRFAVTAGIGAQGT